MSKKIPPSVLKGILSLLGSKIPKWLTNLISKTKGGKEYVESIIEFENPPGSVERLKEVKNKLEQENKNLDFGFSQLFGDLQEQMDKQLTRNDEILKKAADKLDDLDQKVKLSDLVFPEGTIPDKVTLDDLSKMSWEEAQKYGYKKSDWEYMQQYKGKDYETELKKEGYTWNEAENKWQKIEVTEDWSQIPDEYRPVEFKEKVEGYDKSVKEQIEKEKKKGIFKLLQGGKDDDDPTYHAKGGIAGFAPGGIKVRTPKLHDTGLMKSLLKLGTTMGMSEKELLEMAIKFNWDVSDKLKKQYGITDESLRAGSDKGLEWLLLKANPDLAKQPYSESKVNKMLSEEIGELPSKQIDLFKKKTGGLISLIS